MLIIRQMQAADLPAVVKLQDRCYSAELFEPADLVKRRYLAFPQSCWVATYQDKLWGYLFCYPSLIGKVNPLAEDFTEVTQADCLYLHDMAVSSDARGQGVAQQLLAAAEQQAQQLSLSALTLVAVQNSASYWQQRGFNPVLSLSPEAITNLASYSGQQAQYLVKTW
ncbi:GNAT family N-acetyltransferase [Rheinheimera sp.]|uniref:GNAT family N-acetyltransferase n=1 Tax=Rheinheimera sp. TaxID=1869214 RepID=UPI0027BA45A2|nr:GNAT family N-acetyltransferase [Rheinheimera sp.]